MLGRLVSALTLALGLGSGEAAAPPQQVAPEAAPAAWTAYAETVTAILSSWMSGEDETAKRMRTRLDATTSDPAASRSPLIVKLWIAPDGSLGRIAFQPVLDPATDADLRALLTTRHLPPPPRDMLLPLRVALQVEPKPQPTPDPAP